jgi:hypothetical protein
MVSDGAWVLFDNAEQLAHGVLSHLAAVMRHVLGVLRGGDDSAELTIGHQTMQIKRPLACLLNFQVPEASAAVLPHCIRGTFRGTAMSLPDLTPITEVMLQANGFTDPPLYAREITLLYSMCERAFGSFNGGWGIRAIAAVIKFVTLRRLAVVHSLVLDDHQALENAIRE